MTVFTPAPDRLTTATMPRLEQLPRAVLSGHLSRGELHQLGPGVCLPGTTQVPLARLYALNSELPLHTVALCRRTAAWVWAATQTAPEPLEVNMLPSRTRVPSQLQQPLQNGVLKVYFSRYCQAELVCFGDLTVTTRLRTLLDLCYEPDPVTADFVPLCEALCAALLLTPLQLQQLLLQRRHPAKRRALQRAQLLRSTETAPHTGTAAA